MRPLPLETSFASPGGKTGSVKIWSQANGARVDWKISREPSPDQ